MSPQFVKPYVKSNKNDVADAEAICEAVTSPSMRFVPVKSVEQQAVLSLHRARQGFVIARTAQANQIRSLLGEFGLVIPKGICHVAKQVPELLEDASNRLPGTFRHFIARLTEYLKELDKLVHEFEDHIKPGIAAASSASGSRRFLASGRWERAPWSPPSRTRTASTTGESSRLGSAWCRGSIRAEASRPLGHQQARGRVSAHLADSWRVLGHRDGAAQGGEHQRAAGDPAEPTTSERGGRRRGQQERANGLGAAGARARVPTQLRPDSSGPKSSPSTAAAI
jgi:hypothetical protein